jgi:hypothetical protein
MVEVDMVEACRRGDGIARLQCGDHRHHWSFTNRQSTITSLLCASTLLNVRLESHCNMCARPASWRRTAPWTGRRRTRRKRISMAARRSQHLAAWPQHVDVPLTRPSWPICLSEDPNVDYLSFWDWIWM